MDVCGPDGRWAWGKQTRCGRGARKANIRISGLALALPAARVNQNGFTTTRMMMIAAATPGTSFSMRNRLPVSLRRPCARCRA